jgi:hypothetical protein
MQIVDLCESLNQCGVDNGIGLVTMLNHFLKYTHGILNEQVFDAGIYQASIGN